MKLFALTLCNVFAALFPTFSQSQNKTKVAIIGGGMAGISAAHYIHAFDPDADLTLFEKQSTLGGNAKTVEIRNARNETVAVDAGPQYFTEGPWDEYIHFLKIYGQYKEDEISEFPGSVVIQHEGGKRPLLVTPLNGSLRGESLGRLLRFKKFYDTAFKVYKTSTEGNISFLGDWVKKMEIDEAFKKEVVLPFLAASLGTTVCNIKKTSTGEIVKLFAFRKPSNQNTFKVMHRGMGTLIQNIGDALQKSGIHVLTQAPVQKVEYRGGGLYGVSYLYGKETRRDDFDFVVSAVHANQAYQLLKNDTNFSPISAILRQFEYFRARIVLHRDSSLICREKPSFLNIITTTEHQILANTMNLGMIDARYAGIYKSWLTEELCAKVKANGSFLHEEVFYHPLITPYFNASLMNLRRAVAEQKGLFLCGGWTQGLETQETAVVSGIKAMERYKAFKSGESEETAD